MGLDGESRRRFSLKFDLGGGGEGEMKTRYQFFLPLVNGNNGRRRCSIFHGDVIRIKAASNAAGWQRASLSFFSLLFSFPFFHPPPAHTALLCIHYE